jgi:NhaA family Na+:H+ antiporter
MTLKENVKKLFDSEKTSGLILVFTTILSLSFANSPWQTGYINFWHIDLGGESIVHWINDGLMTLFFLLIGLELEHELYKGKLSNMKSAMLPIFGAVGGMAVPAGIFLIFNFNTDTHTGWGIPMATDIAFSIGILSLLGSRVLSSLKVFLKALAIVDDLGAIVIIAIFYTSSLVPTNLFIALVIFIFLLVLNKLKVLSLIPYLIGGVVMWYFMAHSGVHPTITGVLLAFTIPFRTGGEKCPSFILKSFLKKPVAFLVLPLFAVANTCIPIGENWFSGLSTSNSMGIVAGLVIGKPIGIWMFSLLGVSAGLCVLPKNLTWHNIVGVGFLAGIGFTMSIFITLLAFTDTDIVNESKIAILIASLIAGIIGFISLNVSLKKS